MKDCSDLFDDIQWQPLDSTPSSQTGQEYATHTGELRVSEFQIRCYKASNQRTALDVEDIERFFRGCPNCKNPTECLHCNTIDDAHAEPRVAIKLEQEDS